MSDSLRRLSLSYSNADSRGSALRLILTLRPEWKESQDTIEFQRFTDGITNTLLKATNNLPGLSQQDIDKNAVLLRAYGNGTDVLIDREKESQSHALLAKLGLAPQLLARFENGLLYKFIEGDVCSPADLRRPEVWRGVASRLAEWHARLPVSEITSEPRADESKLNGHLRDSIPAFRRSAQMEDIINGITPGKPRPNVWNVMQKWILALPSGNESTKTRKALLQQELQWVVEKLGDTPGINDRPLVFSHCDLLCGNVIREPRNTKLHEANNTPSTTTNGTAASAKACPVHFIDYEYATPAPAAFDIANHFAEWGGFDCDFSVLPTRAQRNDFLNMYLTTYNAHLKVDDVYRHKEQLDQLSAEVDAFRGVPGLYWGIWALIQALVSQIDFDYASYAEVRLGEYWAWKAEDDGSRAREGKEMPLRERRWAQAE